MGLSVLFQSSSLQPLHQAWLFKHTLFLQLMFPAAPRLPAFKRLSLVAAAAVAATAGNSLGFCKGFLSLFGWYTALRASELAATSQNWQSDVIWPFLCSEKHLPLLLWASLLAAFAILFLNNIHYNHDEANKYLMVMKCSQSTAHWATHFTDFVSVVPHHNLGGRCPDYLCWRCLRWEVKFRC